MLPKVQVRPKGPPPLWVFFVTMRLFSKIFEIFQRVPPCIFLKFSVCRKRWMSLNGLFLSFSALCDLKNTFFKKNFKNNFLENFFPNFSNSCSLNIFEPKIWRRLGTFPSCFFSSDYSLIVYVPLFVNYSLLPKVLSTWFWTDPKASTLKCKTKKGPPSNFSALWDFPRPFFRRCETFFEIF